MIDHALINIKSGNGGDGAISGRREKYVPRGGPDGGDGGRGGSIYIKADRNVNTLLKYRYNRHFSAQDGRRGERRLRHGRDGQDVTLVVPVGTQVWIEGSPSVLVADLDESGQRFVVAAGGDGGAGNARYATSTNRFPRLAQAGASGEELTLRLELKLLADVGIIGSPNAGKSSLISVVSAARPKVADYPFTTLEPSLGVVDHRGEYFVMVDIPGLIEGAHAGVGLGHEFLRHVERTRVLVHLIDGSLDDPMGEYRKINGELAQYDEWLGRKPQIVTVNKLDLTDVSVLREDLEEAFLREDGVADVLFISAVTQEGINQLLDRVVETLATAKVETEPRSLRSEDELPILRPTPQRRRPAVYVDDDGGFVVDWPAAARIAVMVDSDDWAAMMQFYNRLQRNGVIEALEEAGIASGDIVRIGDAEWRWE